MGISIAEALRDATRKLNEAGVPDARREAGGLLSWITGKDRTFLISHNEDQISEEERVRFQQALERRASGEPTQYITGRQDFFGREFRVTPDVLIPRPETELLVEAALEVIGADDSEAFFCDVGTGSGCIAVTLLCERSKTRAVAMDVSAQALEVTRQNAREYSVEDRLVLLISDCFESLTPGAQKFDLVVSNPPYVSAEMLPGLQREVRDYEPRIALSPGPDGLKVIRRLLEQAPAFLKENGYLIMEIGFDQGEVVRKLIDVSVWRRREILPDLQSIPRIVVLQKR